jgi:hypothetical protein
MGGWVALIHWHRVLQTLNLVFRVTVRRSIGLRLLAGTFTRNLDCGTVTINVWVALIYWQLSHKLLCLLDRRYFNPCKRACPHVTPKCVTFGAHEGRSLEDVNVLGLCDLQAVDDGFVWDGDAWLKFVGHVVTLTYR